MKVFLSRLAWIFLFLFVFKLSPSFAATQTVTNCGDDGSPGTLRNLIETAASNPGDTIVIPSTCSSPIVLTAAAGGDINIIKDLTIQGQGPAATIVDGGDIDRIFNVPAGVTVTLTELTIQNGTTDNLNNGGGISNAGTLTLSNCMVGNNSSQGPTGGGGIYNTGTLNLSQCILSGNQTVTAGEGGGIYNSGTVTMDQSTVSGNTSVFSSGGIKIAAGAVTITNSTLNGNISTFGGGISNEGTLTMTNSTVSGNTANTTSAGGINNGGTTTLTNVTIAFNSALSGGGGIFQAAGTVNLKNSILAKNTASAGPDCSGTITSQDFNLIGNNTGCTFAAAGNDKVGTAGIPKDPLLAALTNNGGPTQTHALQTGSEAIDNGGSTANGCPATDQRGLTRPQGAACDIGAFEAGPLITFDPTSLTFGSTNVGQVSSPPLTLTIKNEGVSPLTINSITVMGDFAFTSSTPCLTFPATLGIGNFCVLSLTFNPTAAGTRTGFLLVDDNAAASPQSFPLSGIGLDVPEPSSGCRLTKKTSTEGNYLLTLFPAMAILGVLFLRKRGTPAVEFRKINKR